MAVPKGKHAWTVTVGEKGQIVIPKQARVLFHIQPGDTLIVLGDEERGLAIPPKTAFHQFASAVFETEQSEEEIPLKQPPGVIPSEGGNGGG